MTVQPTTRSRLTDPAVLRALLLALVAVLILLAPAFFGAEVLGSPSFDITPDPAGPLPF